MNWRSQARSPADVSVRLIGGDRCNRDGGGGGRDGGGWAVVAAMVDEHSKAA